ncbi:MAG: D-aminoacyl-tRNA deacylase [Candidatus Omnitrophica bacterium]|nr:D-aminoacyl-tRNA deacylase [Candidatus Omnitrophota bacterium]
MRIVIQRVKSASISVEGKHRGSIQRGLVVFVGFGRDDCESLIEQVVRKILKLRIFSDDKGKLNLSLLDVSGGLIIVSQFTLYANTSHGNRPDFLSAMNPSDAEKLFDRFVTTVKNLYSGNVICGDFGKHMVVEIHNDGPVTIILDYESRENRSCFKGGCS